MIVGGPNRRCRSVFSNPLQKRQRKIKQTEKLKILQNKINQRDKTRILKQIKIDLLKRAVCVGGWVGGFVYIESTDLPFAIDGFSGNWSEIAVHIIIPDDNRLWRMREHVTRAGVM